MRWCIYYADGSTYIGDVADAPVVGVQLIAQEDRANGWNALCNFPFYIWDTRDGITKWYCASESGRENYMREVGWKKVLIGSWIGDEQYQKISDRVKNDNQFAMKTGYAWWEWKPDES